MIHFFMILSGKPELEFQAEVFVRSLDLWGKVDYSLTICQGFQDKLHSPLLRNRADVVTYSGDSWHSGFGYVPQKGDVTIYTDADILICNDLNPMLEMCAGKVGGVIAYKSPKIDWKTLFGGCGVKWQRTYKQPLSGECPYYVNLGFVAVPSQYVPALNESMLKFLRASECILPGHYHKPQFAMSLSVESLNLPRITLPIRYNQPDLFPQLLKEEPTVMHLLLTKSRVKNWGSVRHMKADTKPLEIVQKRLQWISAMVL